MAYELLLADADGTLFDFDAGEQNALQVGHGIGKFTRLILPDDDPAPVVVRQRGAKTRVQRIFHLRSFLYLIFVKSSASLA